MSANPIVIDQPQDGPTSPPLHIKLGGWEYLFEFDVARPLTRAEFEKRLKEAAEGVIKEFKQSYPKFMFEELQKFHCIDSESFKQNGNGKG